MERGNEVVVDVEIVGTGTGLLMHKFSAETEAELQKDSKRIKSKESPEVQAEGAAYRLPGEDGKLGVLCQPADHIFMSCVKAAVNFKIPGRRGKTYKDSCIGFLSVEPNYIPHLNGDGEGRTDYVIDSRPVRIQKSRNMRHRPFLEGWRLVFQLIILDDSQLPVDVLHEILTEAGAIVGIGDFRPRFGRYRVTKFQERKAE